MNARTPLELSIQLRKRRGQIQYPMRDGCVNCSTLPFCWDLLTNMTFAALCTTQGFPLYRSAPDQDYLQSSNLDRLRAAPLESGGTAECKKASRFIVAVWEFRIVAETARQSEGLAHLLLR